MSQEPLWIGVLVMGGLIMSNFTSELVKVFFAKMRTSDFVEKTACVACKSQEKEIGQSQKAKIDAIAQLVLAMAIKMGIDTSDISKLL